MMDAPTQEPTRDGLPPMPPGPPHEERHFTQNETVRDLVIGTADGLTVPFALAAALSGAVAANPLIVTAGLAEIAAGCVAMGLGGYLAARTESDHYASERKREEEETHLYPDREKWEVAAILHRYGVRGEVLRQAVDAIASDRKKWVDFMMRFELDLTEPDPNRAAKSAVTIGGAYVVGGLIPLFPYMIFATTTPALLLSSSLTAVALFGFGWLKARATGLPALRGAVQTLAIGGVAAVVAYLVASLFGH
ncbi:VIT1/CCC1 transporter family protein [Falsiroseomonas oryziterrae]|uniref:VIT1/CCC1 transporter family protein n=1 Tax=Falsiroseomonas oryziterrae TaxID=2911368 RepID=UPI001F36FFB3|nr:VIT1/CCC1 transporter family protein [Roseomonas sp. NPKOSM-4]